LVSARSMRKARMASLILRSIETSLVSRKFLATCWVMVEAPTGSRLCRSQPAPVFRAGQQPLVAAVRQIPGLDQDRGDVRRLEHGETGESAIVAQQPHGLRQFARHGAGQFDGFVLGHALAQIDQDARDRLALMVKIDAGDDVGAVLLCRQRRRLAVGRAFRQGVDRTAPDLRIANRIGMQRNEQVGAGALRDPDPVAQPNEHVAVSDHHHPVASRPAELAAQFARLRQRNVLFPDAAAAVRAGIDAAMAGIDRDQRAAIGRRRLARHRLRRGHHGGGPPGGRAAGPEPGRADRLQIDHQAIGPPVHRRQQESLGDRHRARHVDHHAGIAGLEQPQPIALDQPAARHRFRVDTPRHLGQIDDHAIGIGQREYVEFDRLGQVEHETGPGRRIAHARRFHQRRGARGRDHDRGRREQGEEPAHQAHIEGHILPRGDI